MPRLAVHLYQAPLDNASRLLRMARSVRTIADDLHVRLVGLQVDERAGFELVEPGIVIDRIGNPTPKRDTFVSRLTKVGGWSRRVYRGYRRQPVAVVSAHSVWALPLAFALHRATGAALVYNPHELETKVPSMFGVKRFLAEQIERRLIGRCDLVTTVNDQIADWYRDTYGIDRPLAVYNYPAKTTHRPPRDVRTELGLGEEDVLFIHTGNLVEGRNVELMLDAFERAACHHVLFVGAGPLGDLIDEAAARSPFIHHWPPVPVDEVVSVVKGADVALCLIELRATSYAWSSPNKLFEALAAGVPPLCTDLPQARLRLGELGRDLVLNDPRTELVPFIQGLDRETAARYRLALSPLPTWEDGVQPLLDAYRSLVEAPPA